MFSIAVHGGAGAWSPDKEGDAVAGVAGAVEAGREILAAGGSALDAAVAAVVALEDNPIFNAGTGACFNIDGEIEMDAAVMTGHDLQTGCVANVRAVKNPVLLARRIMEETDHILLAGEGAERFARVLGFERFDPETPDRRNAFEQKISRLMSGEDDWLPRMRELLRKYPELSHGTVGVAVLDSHGHLAAATSTGGVSLKLAGRIGDTPIPGAGNYATGDASASATGRGELIMRTLTTRQICDRVTAGASAQEAVDAVIAQMAETVGRHVGVVAVDRHGDVGIAHATDSMPHAFYRDGDSGVTARLRSIVEA